MACDWLRVSRLHRDSRRTLLDAPPGGGRRPRYIMDGSDHECRWESLDGPEVLSRLLQHHESPLSRRSLCYGPLLDSTPCSRPKGQRETDGADPGPALLRGGQRRKFAWVEWLHARGERPGSSPMTDCRGRLNVSPQFAQICAQKTRNVNVLVRVVRESPAYRQF